jgi:hypothetical protein
MPSNFFLNNFKDLINIKIISFSTLYFMNKKKILNHIIITIQNKIIKIELLILIKLRENLLRTSTF